MKKKYLYTAIMLFAILVAGMGLTGWYVSQTQEQTDGQELTVVTSFYPMYIAAENVIGDADGVRLENLSEPQTGCLHDFQLTPEDMVVVDLEGNKVEGKYNPSSDTPTHVVLYNAFPKIGGIVHTHSPEAVAWAQAGRDIPLYGTTHADYFFGPIPCARNLTPEEIEEAYEKNTGLVIIETFETRGIKPMYTPAVLCKNHGPFTWGKDAAEAVHNAVVLEEVAKMAKNTELLNPKVLPAPDCIKEKHFYRKHGANAYYGQN